MAGVPLGEIGVLDYAGQFGLPNARHRAESAAPTAITAQDTRAYLPDAPNGWTRRHWTHGDNTWVHKQRRLSESGDTAAHNMLNSAVDGFMDHRDAYAQRRAFAAGWIYERGDEVIFIGADLLTKGSNNSMIGRGAHKVNQTFNRMNFREGYAVFQGVPYAETMHSSEHKRLFRSFQGRIGYGQEVRIRVRAHATIESVEMMLNHVNHAGLNQLLDQPVTGVGANTPDPTAPQAVELAGHAFDVRDALRAMPARQAREVLQHGRPLDIARAAMEDISLDGERVSQVSE